MSGKTKEFLFSPSDSAGDIAQTVFDNWPEGKREARNYVQHHIEFITIINLYIYLMQTFLINFQTGKLKLCQRPKFCD